MNRPVVRSCQTLALASLWALLGTSPFAAAATELPPPTGASSVGTLVLFWTDPDRLEGGTDDPDDHRWLEARVWYPAAGGAPDATPYVARAESLAPRLGDDEVERLAAVRPRALWRAPAAEGAFPLVVFLPGWQSRVEYSTILLEEIASRGRLVVGLNQPFQSVVARPDGSTPEPSEAHFADPLELVRYYGADVSFALDRLAALPLPGDVSVSTDRVIAVGHSNGGLGVVAALDSDPRVDAGVLLDKWEPAFEAIFRLSRPLLVLRTGTAPQPSEAYRADTPVQDLDLGDLGHGAVLDRAVLDAGTDEERETALRTIRRVADEVLAFAEGASGAATETPASTAEEDGAEPTGTASPDPGSRR